MPRSALALALALLLPWTAGAEVYKCHYRGQIVYTDNPKLYRSCHRLGLRGHYRRTAYSRPRGQSLKRLRRRFDPLIRRVARRVGLDPEMLHAVVAVESGYNPSAVSPKGAAGLMQLMPETARRYGLSPGERFDPEKNLLAGARYLRDLLEMFNGNLKLALAAYNAGEERVIQYGYRIPPFRETRLYVAKVMARYLPTRAR